MLEPVYVATLRVRHRTDLGLLQNEVKPDKMKKIVWPEAQELIGMLLQENVEDRPKSWDIVFNHPFLNSDNSAALLKKMDTLQDTLQDGQNRTEKKLDAIVKGVSDIQGFGLFTSDEGGLPAGGETPRHQVGTHDLQLLRCRDGFSGFWKIWSVSLS